MSYRRIIKGTGNRLLLYFHRNSWRLLPKRTLGRRGSITINRPIFLLGVQGGGLTLVSRILRRNANVVSVTGNASYWAGPDEMQNVMGSILPAEVTGLHYKVPFHQGYPERNWLYAIDDLLPLYRKTAADATPEMASRFQEAIRRALILHAKDTQKAQFVDKSQSFTVRLSLVNALLNGCFPHFILITRNPYAVCYRTATRVGSLKRLDLSLEERLDLASQHWANSYQCALRDASEVTHFMVVRFEDILQEPRSWLEKICAFLELAFHPSMLPAADHRLPLGSTGSSRGDHKWYPLRPDVNQPYLERLEPWMVSAVNSKVLELATEWNYSPKGP